jgi:hypothetical protein
MVQRRWSLLPPCSTISFGFPASLRTRPWTGRRSGTGGAPRLSRCSTPPDPLNHIHNRMPDLHGGGLGSTEPLRRSRCYLLLVFDRRSGVNVSIPRRQTAVCSQLLILTRLMQKMSSNACWTVSRRGTLGGNRGRRATCIDAPHGAARRPLFTACRTKCTRLSAHLRSLFYNFDMWLGQRRNVFAPLRQSRLSAHNVGAVFVNAPDT